MYSTFGIDRADFCHRLTAGVVQMLGMHGTVAANFAVDQADLLLAFGVRFDDRVTGKLETFAANAKIVHIDIDPAELDKNKESFVAVTGESPSRPWCSKHVTPSPRSDTVSQCMSAGLGRSLPAPHASETLRTGNDRLLAAGDVGDTKPALRTLNRMLAEDAVPAEQYADWRQAVTDKAAEFPMWFPQRSDVIIPQWAVKVRPCPASAVLCVNNDSLTLKGVGDRAKRLRDDRSRTQSSFNFKAGISPEQMVTHCCSPDLCCVPHACMPQMSGQAQMNVAHRCCMRRQRVKRW